MTSLKSLRAPFVVGAASAALLFISACGEPQKAGPPPPANVLVSPVARQDLAVFIEAVGTLDGYVNAEIRARVRGYLKAQSYPDGAPVKEGQLLFTIDPSEYVTALNAAKAAVLRAQAARTHGTVQVERYKALLPSGTVSQQEVDNAVASDADADGQLRAAQAQLDQAQLNLSYTQMRAPISGVAGLALVRVGNLVGQDGPTLLTTVSQVDPVRVNFPMSEVDYVRSPDALKRLHGRDLAWAKRQFAQLDAGRPAEGGDLGVELLLADGSVYAHRGVVVAANRQVDSSTGTIQLQALFPNPESTLRPGQYGRVRIRRQDQGQGALVVPDKAIISVQGTYSLAVVSADNKVQLRRVELGPASRGLRAVTSGVSEGERVVVEGVQKVSDGATVAPQPAPPASAAAPPPIAASSAGVAATGPGH